MKRSVASVVMLVLLALTATRAEAALQSCNVSATTLAFGAYDPLRASPTDGVGTVSVVCTVTLVAILVTWDIRLSTGGSNSFASRRMLSGANQLNYNLYLDSGRSTIWGDGTASTSFVSGITLLAIGTNTLNFSVYGRIPAGQDRGAGSYSDPIIVTLNY